MSFDNQMISNGYSIAEQLNHEFVCNTQENNLKPSKNEVGKFLLNCKMLNGINFNFKQITLGDDKKTYLVLKNKTISWMEWHSFMYKMKKTINIIASPLLKNQLKLDQLKYA